MNKERIIYEAGISLASLGLLSQVIRLAFSYEVRKEIGSRDHWTCQAEGCDDGHGRPKSFKNGWMIYASHILTHDKNSPIYNKPETGRCHCIECEILFHEELLQQAIEANDKRQIIFNESALRKLNKVDHRTYDYRMNPEKYEEAEYA